MPELIVDTARIRHNAQIVFEQAGGARVIGVVKGNGYGLELVPYARTLIGCGVDMLAVAALDEALALRSAGVDAEILLMTPLADEREIRTAVLQNVILTAASLENVRSVNAVAAAVGLSPRVHLCVDTGLGRHGFAAVRQDLLLAAARELRGVRIEGIFSHFADAAGKRPSFTQKQLALFLNACAFLEENGIRVGMRHIAAACALLRFPQTRLDAVRVGSAFLGRVPLKNIWGFQPVGYLRSRVEAVYTRAAGQNVGYGHGFVTAGETRTAVLSAGYGCGFGLSRENRSGDLVGAVCQLRRMFRHRAQPLTVRIGGAQCPVLGGVGFTSCVVDVTAADCRPGDSADLPVNPLWIDSSVRRTYICASGSGRTEQLRGLASSF